jgi:DNA-binding SARP family transcriptional activator
MVPFRNKGATMSRLALYFLGPPLVLLDGESVDISRRKVLSLLIYLAVTAKRHSRDELAEWFYGKYDREHARANLRQTMSRLRRAIGKDRLDTDRLGVRLSRSDDMWIDTAEYKRLLESGKTADAKGDFSTAVTDLDRAVGLCRGEFLSGFYLKDSTDFEDWQMAVQESLRREHYSVCWKSMKCGASTKRPSIMDCGGFLWSPSRRRSTAG